MRRDMKRKKEKTEKGRQTDVEEGVGSEKDTREKYVGKNIYEKRPRGKVQSHMVQKTGKEAGRGIPRGSEIRELHTR